MPRANVRGGAHAAPRPGLPTNAIPLWLTVCRLGGPFAGGSTGIRSSLVDWRAWCGPPGEAWRVRHRPPLFRCRNTRCSAAIRRLASSRSMQIPRVGRASGAVPETAHRRVNTGFRTGFWPPASIYWLTCPRNTCCPKGCARPTANSKLARGWRSSSSRALPAMLTTHTATWCSRPILTRLKQT